MLKTKAAVLVDHEKIEVREIPLPEVGNDDGLLRVEITGVCGADWPIYKGLPGTSAGPPIILGHETVGRVARVGAAASRRWNVKAGDRVVIEEYVPCGHCDDCLSGHYHVCRERMYGFTSFNVAPGLWGGYSEYLYLHPHARIHKLADSVSTEIAPLFLPISNGIRWVQVGGVKIGSTVVVLGPGSQGLGCVVAAKESGAGTIIAAGRSVDRERLEVARALGADHIVDVEAEDPLARVREITNGAMADVVVNATANAPAALQLAVGVAGRWATVVMAGMCHRPAEGFLSDLVAKKELSIRGVLGRSFRELRQALRLIESRKYPLEKQCTHRFPIEQAERAIKTVGREGDPGAIHVAVTGS